jgi:hypothetical protein
MTRAGTSKQARRFHEPLLEGDTETTTIGCRHTNPDICSKNSLDRVCAFARPDGVCLAPPATWAKQFRRLRDGSTDP